MGEDGVEACSCAAVALPMLAVLLNDVSTGLAELPSSIW